MTRVEHSMYWSSIATWSYALGFVAAVLAFLAGKTQDIRERGGPSAFALSRLAWVVSLVPTAAATWIAEEGDLSTVVRDHVLGPIIFASLAVAVVSCVLELSRIRANPELKPLVLGVGLACTSVATFLLSFTPFAYSIAVLVSHGNWPPR